MTIRTQHTRITLASRPQGLPTLENFRFERGTVPQPEAGQLLLHTVYLSLDPYMRLRMNEGTSYAQPVGIGEVMVGGAICRVEVSLHPDYHAGDWVLAYTGWQSHAISDGKGLRKLNNLERPSLALGVLGMPGFTAYLGLLEIGRAREGETVVVAAATGAVGAAVGQIAKLTGCRVVGIAGGPDKCRYAVEELGFDACLDHKAPQLAAALAAACPQGIDVYFENVGGAIFDAVLPLLNKDARVPVCGLIAHYNDTGLPEGPNQVPALLSTLLTKRISMQGFINFDYEDRYPAFLQTMGNWVKRGEVVYREDLVPGLEQAPHAFIGMLNGRNFGKLIVAVS
ncbi:NADP-dependent oxidoreductase [Chitinimonas sp. BJB300]|uniref:NADP-dependent oxidoreductase n=1 Tax=Chitinimonas sp. BJB300 TaxID=1559339 RepID=UPI000C1041C5|nr:NADP-dependent oxidoreductase [Chitinimonas sp. BJB300]PHV11682.1 NADP-dependent oxidoreductase [Chitinimonas sp. BJB300]